MERKDTNWADNPPMADNAIQLVDILLELFPTGEEMAAGLEGGEREANLREALEQLRRR